MKTLRKLSIFLFVLCTLVFALSTAMIGRIYKKILFENTYDTAFASLRQVEYHFSEKINVFSNVITRLLAGDGLREAAYEEDLLSVYAYDSVNHFNQEAQEVLNFNSEIASVIYINQDQVMLGTDGKTVWKEQAGEKLLQGISTLPEGFAFRGGLDSGLFYENKAYLKPKKEYYITAVVPCFFSREPLREGVLLLNIKESAVRNIFSAMLGDDMGEIYIADDNGLILTSTREERIREKCLLWEEIVQKEEESYFVHDADYVISYQMQTNPWRIVWERPVDSFYTQANRLYHILIRSVLCSLLVVFLCYGIYSRILLKPLKVVMEAMANIGRGNYGIRIDMTADGEIGKVIQSFNVMSEDIEKLTSENARIQNEKRTLQLMALQEQMSPHFVLNALNTIKWMAMLNREENIVNMVIALSKVIRAFKNTNAFGTVEEEIEFIRNYIVVMNYRYGDVISVHYQVEEALKQRAIPIFFIQPLVENALKHGFASTNCKGDIWIQVTHEQQLMFVRVTDNGSGMSEEKRKELNEKLHITNQMPLVDTGGVGLVNIAKRIQLYYGEEYGIRVYPGEQKGLTAELVLPYE